jgi:hypothetical protein
VAVADNCIGGPFSGFDPVAMDRAVMHGELPRGLPRPAGDRAHDVEAIRGLLSCGNFLLHVGMVLKAVIKAGIGNSSKTEFVTFDVVTACLEAQAYDYLFVELAVVPRTDHHF